MYEDRNLAEAKYATDQIGTSTMPQGAQASEFRLSNFGVLIIKNVLMWGSAAISCGAIYLLLNLFF